MNNEILSNVLCDDSVTEFTRKLEQVFNEHTHRIWGAERPIFLKPEWLVLPLCKYKIIDEQGLSREEGYARMLCRNKPLPPLVLTKDMDVRLALLTVLNGYAHQLEPTEELGVGTVLAVGYENGIVQGGVGMCIFDGSPDISEPTQEMLHNYNVLSTGKGLHFSSKALVDESYIRYELVDTSWDRYREQGNSYLRVTCNHKPRISYFDDRGLQ